MLTQNLVVADHGAANHTFNLYYQQGSETRRLDIGTTSANPQSLTIRHSVAGKAPNLTDRHNFVFSKTNIDDETGVPATGSISVTINSPRNGIVSPTEMLDLMSFVKNFLTDANFAALGRNES